LQPYASLSSAGQVRRLRRLVQAALASYGLSGARVQLLAHGYNTTFMVVAPGAQRWVLRVHRSERRADMIRAELQWLAALHTAGLRVPEPAATESGDLVVTAVDPGVPDPQLCSLLRWIPGRFLDDGLTPAHLAQIGGLMAQLQQHGAQFQRAPGWSRPPVGYATSLARREPDLWGPAAEAHAADLAGTIYGPQGAAAVEGAFARVREARATLGQGPEVYGLIHADLHQENYLFDQGAAAAIDFDDCGMGYYLYDLAVTLAELYHRPDYPALRSALLEGYARIRPLPAAHEPLIETFMAYRDMQGMLWLIEEREHPAFREGWRAESTHLFERLQGWLG
jgi:Ser/Thr protein kinase RdoA (MazF antagonist)